MAEELWDAGADAIIAQDLGLLKVASRRIKFHASTQCHADSADKARFLEAAGFAAVVLARETPLEGISDAAGAVGIPIGVFCPRGAVRFIQRAMLFKLQDRRA